nr:serine hydrolase [Kineosphaera limosa]
MVGAATAAALVLSGCSSPYDGAASTDGRSPGAPGTAAPSRPAVTPTATAHPPNDAVGRQMSWMLGQMNTDPVSSDVSSRFTEQFQAEVPPAQWLVMLGQLRAQAPWVLESVTSDGKAGSASVVAQGRRYSLTMTVDDAGRIDGALLKEGAQGETATTWPQVEQRAQLAAPQVSILAATVGDDGSLEVVHRSGEQGVRPIASMFKLYVLAAVAEQVRDGALSWDQQLRLTAQDKTLPSGTLQERPDGTAVTVREAADLMIRISDNTATDLLMRAVGEDTVRAAAARAGATHPEGITPFLTPRQMFWLGYGDAPQALDARAKWAAADAQTRAQLLEQVPMPGPGPENIDMTSTPWRSGVGWFATPQEVVQAHLYLDTLAGDAALAPLREILTKNGGIAVPDWSEQAFKGGSDSGVIALSFLAPPPQGTQRRQALVMIGTGERPVDEETFVAATADAARLLSEHR